MAGEVSLRCTTGREAQGSPAFVRLRTEDGGSLVFAHRRAYPMLVGRRIEIDCRRRLGVRSFSSSLPPDLGLRASFGRMAVVDIFDLLVDCVQNRLKHSRHWRGKQQLRARQLSRLTDI